MKTMLSAVISVFCMGSVVWAEEPVHFADPALKAAVERELWVVDPTPTDMLRLVSFSAVAQDINDLTGLECAANLQIINLLSNQVSSLFPLSGLTNLTTLSLSDNELSDLSPLSGLTHLDTLTANQNQISDLSPLAGLTSLHTLDLHDNEISDISALSGLINLRKLALRENPLHDISPLSSLKNLAELSLLNTHISDLSPLSSLKSLRSVDVRGCPLSQESFDVIIPEIKANNPGINLEVDSHALRLISITSGAGGTVVRPGVGDFLYEDEALILVEARPDPGFVFGGWSGTYPSSQSAMYVSMDRDYQFRASFLSTLDTLHVDGRAAGSPGPNDLTRSDSSEDGTPEHPFDRIQDAIDVAGEDVSIIVHPGIYRENIDLMGKFLHLTGTDPNDPDGAPRAVIEGVGDAPVVRFAGGGPNGTFRNFVTHYYGMDSTVTGFVITQGRGRPAAGVFCDDSSPKIANCLIVGNRSTNVDGAAVYCTNSQATLTNCTIADNYGGLFGAGLVLVDSDVTVTNSILWGNGSKEIVLKGTSNPSIRYCDVQGWWTDVGNFNVDPLFAGHGSWVDPDNPREILHPQDSRAIWLAGDYHLKSQAGRWDPNGQRWVQDEVSSPCLDAGDPSSPVGDEPAPNGGVINVGAYGGTGQASKSRM